ncbi:MAG: UDP-2,3-diacylglucosamine diphosphatase [Bacteroidaceae bacterium]|nr:UDP-2,3-diacylglucosamine diphosphatase [Bacteroidaceae bacterium]
MKNIYFISDAHLGSRAVEHRRTQERRLVNFLDKIKGKAAAIYMLGDMFDFWFEYQEVVPKGYTRFLGKISELTDLGVEVHYFTGNHDMWMDNYLETECGVILHRQPCTMDLFGKVFYLAHGDRLDYRDKAWKTRLMFWCFHNKTLEKVARWIHPHWFMNFGLNWAKHSRMKRSSGALRPDAEGRILTKDGFHNDTRLVGYQSAPDNGEEPYQGEDKEGLVLYAKDYLKTHPDINYFIFGHRHIELDLMLNRDTRLLILGEWLTLFTYVVWDGKHLFMDNFIEGETEL